MSAQPNKNNLAELLIGQDPRRRKAFEELQDLWPDEKALEEFQEWLPKARRDEA